MGLLAGASIQLVADIRTVRRSRANPQYGGDALAAELPERQIVYEPIAELGGLRGAAREVPPEINGNWRNRSFHNYADYAFSSPAFVLGLERLEAFARVRPTAMMCAEAVWWRCHRRIVSDYLLMRGWEVLHVMSAARAEPASLTPGAVSSGGRVAYPLQEAASV